ncbi:unnamed protein product, partial [Urochloa humidicola]
GRQRGHTSLFLFPFSLISSTLSLPLRSFSLPLSQATQRAQGGRTGQSAGAPVGWPRRRPAVTRLRRQRRAGASRGGGRRYPAKAATALAGPRARRAGALGGRPRRRPVVPRPRRQRRGWGREHGALGQAAAAADSASAPAAATRAGAERGQAVTDLEAEGRGGCTWRGSTRRGIWLKSSNPRSYRSFSSVAMYQFCVTYKTCRFWML